MDAPATLQLRAGVELAVRLGLCPAALAAGEADRLRRQLAITIDPAAVAERVRLAPALLAALARVAARLPTDAPLESAREALLAEGVGVTSIVETVASDPTGPTASVTRLYPRNRPRVPSRLGPYELGEEIGHGGMGVVFRARHQHLDSPCAIKVMIAGEHASPESIARFQREAAAVAKMGKHPNIVGVFDLGEEEGLAYYAMELVDGVPLGTWRRERSPGYAEIARLVEKVARALHFAHERGVVHRDVKPENVIVRPDAEPQVMDFGLAREMGSSARLSSPGQVMGTPSYMAPEQARGDIDHVDRRSDVYSVGGVLYELLVGVPPHAGKTIEAVLDSVLRGEVLAPRRIARDVPIDLETICLKCLSTEPSRRYATAEELAEDLARYGRRETIVARRAGTVERIVRKALKHRSVVVPVAIILLVAAALSSWLLVQRRRADEELARRQEKEERRRQAKERVDRGRTKPAAIALGEFLLATQIDGDWPEASLELARAYAALGRYEAARSELYTSILLAQRAGEKPVQAHYLRGQLLDNQFFLPVLARADYLAAAELAPGSDIALLSLGVIHLRGLEGARAAECLRRAIQANPERADAYVELARTACVEGRFDLARDLATQAIEREPGQPQAGAILLANMAIEGGYAKLDLVDRLAKLCARDPELLIGLATGLARIEADGLDEAVVDRAMAMAPHNPRCLVQKAGWLEATGHPLEEILACFAEAERLAPYDWTAPMRRGAMFLRMGGRANLDRAKTDFEAVILLDPGLPTAVFLRAMIAQGEEKSLEAIEFADRGLALQPDPGWASFAELVKARAHAALVEFPEALECIGRARAALKSSDELARDLGFKAGMAPQESEIGTWEALFLEQGGEHEAALRILAPGRDEEGWELPRAWERGHLLLLLGRYAEGAEVMLQAALDAPLDAEMTAQLEPLVKRIHVGLRAADDPGDPPRILDPMVNLLFMLARTQGGKATYAAADLENMCRSQWFLWKKAGDQEGLLAAAKRWAKASPKSPSALYHLAAARAFAGQAAEASQALDAAEKAGFRNWKLVRTAPEFGPVRKHPAFRER